MTTLIYALAVLATPDALASACPCIDTGERE